MRVDLSHALLATQLLQTTRPSLIFACELRNFGFQRGDLRLSVLELLGESDDTDSCVLDAVQLLVDEVVRINATARNRAMRYALTSLGVAGLIGGVAALFLPGRVRRTAAERSSGQLEPSAEIGSLSPELASQPPGDQKHWHRSDSLRAAQPCDRSELRCR